jgi:CubicO group peptidase (beta-lactamase class C family)
MPSTPIPRAVLLAALLVSPAAALVPEAPPAKVALEAPVADAIALADLWIREQMSYHGVPGLAIAVVRGGETIWSAGYGAADLASGAPVTPDTRFRLGSVSKLFTATAVMILRDEGRLQLEDPVRRHLPWFKVRNPFPDAPEPTVGQLLTHTSGLPREAPFPYWTTHDFPTREAVRDALPALALVSRPGESYRYSNLGVALLGEIVATVSGESWGAFVDRRVLAPLGMRASVADPDVGDFPGLARAYLRQRPDGSRGDAIHYETRAISPAAAVVSTADDLAKFAAFHLRSSGAEAASPTVPLAASTRREMQRARFVYPSWSGGRGLGFAVTRVQERTYVAHGGWIGGHRTDLVLDPGRDLAVVAMTNADDASPALFSRKLLDVVGGAFERAKENAAVATGPRVADPTWSRYLGLYTDPWEWETQVVILDGGLVLYEHDYPPDDDPDSAIVRLTPTDTPGAFKMSDGEPVVFETDAEGNVVRIRRRFEYLTPKRPAR